ncbi:MAG: gene transfer agent family protein [Beijerinckiaceae bacterium]
MANRYRGEVSFDLDGKTVALRLTLGSLAHLEGAFGADGLQALGARLSEGRLSAGDVLHVLAAGFLGAGESIDMKELGALIPATALEQAATAAANLLAAAFGAGDAPNPP